MQSATLTTPQLRECSATNRGARPGLLRYVLTAGGWAVLDQALFAGGNIVLTLLLARWVQPDEFGAFTMAYMVLLFLAAIHTAFLVEPMLIFGSTTYCHVFRKYVRVLLSAHFLLTIPASCLIYAAWKFAPVPLLLQPRGSVRGLALSVPMILLFWLFRRVPYVSYAPWRAACGTTLYFLTNLSGAIILHQWERLSGESAMIVLAASGLVGSTAIFLLERRTQPLDVPSAAASNAESVVQYRTCGLLPTPVTSCDGRALWSAAASSHISYGRWAIVAALAAWLEGNAQYAVTNSTLGLADVGALKAITTMLQPIWQAMNAITTMCIPVFSRMLTAAGLRLTPMPRTTTCRVVAAIAVVLGTLVLAWKVAPAVFIIISGQRYAYCSHYVALYLLILVPEVPASIAMSVRRALRQNRAIVAFYLALTTVTVILQIVLSHNGLLGVIASRVIAAFTVSITFIVLTIYSLKSRIAR